MQIASRGWGIEDWSNTSVFETVSLDYGSIERSGDAISTNVPILAIRPIATSKISIRNKSVPQALNTSYSCYSDLGKRVISFHMPHFIIAGAQKAGTSAISAFLSDIPGFLRTTKNEGHFLEGLIKRTKDCKRKPNSCCKKRERYSKLWDSNLIKPNTILYEKSPLLIARTKMAERVSAFLPGKSKIVVILRDPVERMYSSYKMGWQDSGKKLNFRSFEDEVKNNLKILIDDGAIQVPAFSNVTTEWNQADFLIGAPLNDYSVGRLSRGFYADQIKKYMEFFPLNDALKVIHYESFLKNKSAVLQDLLEFVGGPPSYKFIEERLDESIRPRNFEEWYPPMTNETKVYLKHLYKPFNDKLADILGDSWRGVWD